MKTASAAEVLRYAMWLVLDGANLDAAAAALKAKVRTSSKVTCIWWVIKATHLAPSNDPLEILEAAACIAEEELAS